MTFEPVFNTYLELASNACKARQFQLATSWFKVVIDELQSADHAASFQVEVLHKMAIVYTDHQQYRQAEAAYRRALSLWNILPADDTRLKCGTLMQLAELSVLQGKYGQAEQYLRRAITAEKTATRPDQRKQSEILLRLVFVLVKRKKLAAAHSALQVLAELSKTSEVQS